MIAITKLIQLLHKEGLLKWANKIGLEGVRLEDYRKQSSAKGSDLHQQVQDYLLLKKPFEHSDKLEKCLEGFEIVSVEENFNNGFISCRTDLQIKNETTKVVVDFKSNRGIYLDQKLQLSTYKEILKYDKIAIINFDKWELQYLEIDTEKYFDIIRYLYKIHTELSALNERV